MADPVRARRLSDEEGRRLQQIVRRGKHGSVRVRASYHRTHGIRYRRPGRPAPRASPRAQPAPATLGPPYTQTTSRMTNRRTFVVTALGTVCNKDAAGCKPGLPLRNWGRSRCPGAASRRNSCPSPGSATRSCRSRFIQ
jgi:hypothetical protein